MVRKASPFNLFRSENARGGGLGNHSQTNQYAQLPLSLLTTAQGHPMLVELKNGETLNGHLVNCDTWMNLTLKEVVQTSPVSFLLCLEATPGGPR